MTQGDSVDTKCTEGFATTPHADAFDGRVVVADAAPATDPVAARIDDVTAATASVRRRKTPRVPFMTPFSHPTCTTSRRDEPFSVRTLERAN
jgi:hypothetical protein